MYPILFKIGSFSVYSYGTVLAIAFLTVIILALREARLKGLDTDVIIEIVLVAMLMAIIGARLGFIIVHRYYLNIGWNAFFAFRSGGLSFHGGFIGALIGGYLYSLYKNAPFVTLLDLFSPYIALGYGIARFGCFLNGCCYGKVTTVPWALPILSFDGLPRHPAQLYAMVAGFVIYAVLNHIKKRETYNGYLFLMLIFLYSIYRFIIEFFREVEYWGYLSVGQVFSLLIIVLVLLIMFVKFYYKSRKC